MQCHAMVTVARRLIGPSIIPGRICSNPSRTLSYPLQETERDSRVSQQVSQ